MTQPKKDLLTEIENSLKDSFRNNSVRRLPSTAVAPAADAQLDQILLDDDERDAMPYTKDQYLIRENPRLVQWERELRKFLRNLTPRHGHRVAAVMVYEWATGNSIAQIMADEAERKAAGITPASVYTWRGDLKKLNQLLKEYFGAPYMTYIMGRKVPRTYRVPPGWYVYRHRPRTNTLYAEWASGIKL